MHDLPPSALNKVSRSRRDFKCVWRVTMVPLSRSIREYRIVRYLSRSSFAPRLHAFLIDALMEREILSLMKSPNALQGQMRFLQIERMHRISAKRPHHCDELIST